MTPFHCALNYKAKGPFTLPSQPSPMFLDLDAPILLFMMQKTVYSHLVKVRYGLLFTKSGPARSFLRAQKSPSGKFGVCFSLPGSHG